MTTPERIKELRKIYCDGNNIKFAEVLEESPQATSNWVSGKRGIGIEVIEKLLRKFPEVSADWLLTGKGEMLNNPEKKSSEPIEESMYSLPLSAWRVIESQMKSLETSVQQNKEVIEMLRHERKKTGNDAGGHFLAASAAGED